MVFPVFFPITAPGPLPRPAETQFDRTSHCFRAHGSPGTAGGVIEALLFLAAFSHPAFPIAQESSPQTPLPRRAPSLPTTHPWANTHAEIPVILSPGIILGHEDSLAFGFSAAPVTTPSLPSSQWLLSPLATSLSRPPRSQCGPFSTPPFPSAGVCRPLLFGWFD